MLVELLRRAAGEDPDQPVIISSGRPMTYAACLARAEAVARGLRDRGIERFGSAVDDPADSLVLLVAASAIGSEPCLYPRGRDDAAVRELAERFGHTVVVTDGAASLGAAQVVPLDELPVAGDEPLESPEHAPVMILTTGTTGGQKGARHDWSRLVQAVRHPDERSGARWLLAYNLNQFAGIQVLLHVLVSRATLVAPRSSQAHDAIEAMREAQTTHVSATPTFWRLLVGGLDEDAARELPLQQITLGGEPAPDTLIERLRALFPNARLSHVYAGTEFGSIVSVRDGRAGLPVSVLERTEDADARLRIVDGELQISSRVGMLGYHEGADAPEEWRSTGDLVEVSGDRIHFVGRTTDIINVGGAKVHPLPIEELACSVPGVELAAAYGRPNPVTGQIVALDVVAAPDADTDVVEAGIREACAVLPAPGRPRRIRFVDALELRGHKLIRGGTAASAS